jgi:hypothetical protein
MATPSGEPTGHGLTGMRERIAMYGGTVWAGSLPGGGFRVRAWLPCPQSPALHDSKPEQPPEQPEPAEQPVQITSAVTS